MHYVFKWGPESVWVVLTAVMTYAMTLTVTDFTDITDWRKFAVSIGVGLMRAVLGAMLATGTGGFRPQTPTGPQQPTIDEQVGVNPHTVARPTLSDRED